MKTYQGIINQSGKTPPEVKELGENSIGEVTWEYKQAGMYWSNEKFPENTIPQISNIGNNAYSASVIYDKDDGKIKIYTFNCRASIDDGGEFINTPLDGVLQNLLFKIEQY